MWLAWIQLEETEESQTDSVNTTRANFKELESATEK